MKKTKGAALILTICTIMLLTILTITVLSLATVQSKNIAIREKKQQAHYISESGVNLAIAKFNMGNSTFDAKVNYEYTIGQYNDLLNISNNKEKISITSIANNSKGISRQIDAILDTNKSAKNNVFGKTSLKYALSIVGDMKDEEPIKDINNDSSIKIDSQVFIQGAKVNLTLNNKFLPIDNGLNLKKRELVIKAKDVYIDDKKIFGIITMPTFPAFSNVYIDAPDISEIKFSGNHSSVSKSNIPIAKILKINSESIYGNKEDKTDGKYYEKTKTWSETLKINGSEMIGIYQKGKPIQFNEAINKISNKITFSDNISEWRFITKAIYEKLEQNIYKKNVIKILIVDGDLNIVAGDYKNCVIYCTGKTTFNGNVKFENSSIYTKNVELNSAKVDISVDDNFIDIFNNNIDDVSTYVNEFITGNLKGKYDAQSVYFSSWEEH